MRFCEEHGISALPANEQNLLLYVSYLHKQGLKETSIRVYLAAVRSMHVMSGLVSPLEGCPRLELALKAVGKQNDPPAQKLAITYELLTKMCSYLGNTYDHVLLKAAFTLAHFGLLRAAEFTVDMDSNFQSSLHLCLGDITIKQEFQGPIHMVVHVKQCKTDKRNNGTNVIIGCSEMETCALCCMAQFLPMRRQIHGNDQTKPLFMFKNGAILTKSLLVKQTRVYVSLTGIGNVQRYTGHSFRVGGATSAAAVGMSDWEIKLMGRWTSNSYQRYIKAPLALLAGFARRTSLQPIKNPQFTYRNPYIKNLH